MPFSLCRDAAVIEANKTLGSVTIRAFGSAYSLGQKTGIEGAWLGPMFTAPVLMILGLLSLFARNKPTLLRRITIGYAIVTGVVELERLVYDVSRHALVWAALHNLPEWGIIGFLLLSREKAGKWWVGSCFWIWFVIQGILFLPNVMAAGIWEQIVGIWCDWGLVYIFAYKYFTVEADYDNPEQAAKAKAVYGWGFAGAIMHMVEILPLVSLLVGIVTPPNIFASFLIAFTSPITYYLYYHFGLKWDALVAPTGADAPKTATAAQPAAEATNGHAPANGDTAGPGRQRSADGFFQTNVPKWIIVGLLVASFVSGVISIMGPVVVVPECADTLHRQVGEDLRPGLSVNNTFTAPDLGHGQPLGGPYAPVSSNPSNPQPSSSAQPAAPSSTATPPPPPPPPPSTHLVDTAAQRCFEKPFWGNMGSARVVVKPGKDQQVSAMLLWMQPLIQAEEGNMKYELGATPEEHAYSFIQAWSSLRTVIKHTYTSPVVKKTWLDPHFLDMAANITLAGPYSRAIPCSLVEAQPDTATFEVDYGTLDASLDCLKRRFSDWKDVSWASTTPHGVEMLLPTVRKFTSTSPDGTTCDITEVLAVGQPLLPAPVQPEGGFRLQYHVTDACYIGQSPGAITEGYVGEITLMPAPDSPRTRTRMTYKGFVTPKTQEVAAEALSHMHNVIVSRVPFMQDWAKKECREPASQQSSSWY